MKFNPPYLHIKLEEPDNVVWEGEYDDEDDEEPSMTLISWFPENINESCVALHSHSHGGVDTGCEGDVDEGDQDGDHLQHGEVLQGGEEGGRGVDNVGKQQETRVTDSLENNKI